MSDGDVKARQAEELREIKAGLASRTESLARDLLGEPSSKGGGQLRFGANGALAVSTRGSDRGKFFNHADSSQKGDMLDLIHSRVGGSFASAVEYARSYLGMPKPDYSRPMTDVARHQMERRQQCAAVGEAEAREKAATAELARHEAVAQQDPADHATDQQHGAGGGEPSLCRTQEDVGRRLAAG